MVSEIFNEKPLLHCGKDETSVIFYIELISFIENYLYKSEHHKKTSIKKDTRFVLFFSIELIFTSNPFVN